jgi:hypothetical protein
VRQAGDIFETQNPRFPHTGWCDPVSEYIRPFVNSVADVIDPVLNSDVAFLQGEFLLALLPLAGEPDPNVYQRRIPAPGSYLYHNKAKRILTRFLREQRLMIEGIFGAELRGMLERSSILERSRRLALASIRTDSRPVRPKPPIQNRVSDRPASASLSNSIKYVGALQFFAVDSSD